MICFGNVPANTVLPIPFASYTGSTGASSTISGLAVTDIEVYKGTSMTQRSSDNGYALMDTDGIDIDGITGINGFSIDLSDNTDAGFYAAGSYYWVIVSAITVDSQTVNFVAATFRIVSAEGTAGVPVADAVRWNNLATVELPLVPTTAGRKLDVSAGGEAGIDWANIGSPTTSVALTGTTIAVTQKVDVDTIKTNPVVNGGTVTFPTNATLASTTNITAGTITTVTNLTNAPTNGDFTATMKTSIGTAVAASAVASVTGNVGGNVVGSVGSVVGAVGSVTGAVGSVTGNVGGNVTGSVGSVVGAVGSVTGAVGSVTGNVGGNVVGSVASVVGNVGGNVTGSVGSVATGGITAASFAAGAVDAAAVATDAVNEIADGFLNRDMSTGTDSGSASVRTPRQALRAIRNKNNASLGIVYKEDDTTSSWTYTVTTDAAAEPITIIDPA